MILKNSLDRKKINKIKTKTYCVAGAVVNSYGNIYVPGSEDATVDLWGVLDC